MGGFDGSGQDLELSAEFLRNSWTVKDQVKENIETINERFKMKKGSTGPPALYLGANI